MMFHNNNRADQYCNSLMKGKPKNEKIKLIQF